MGVRRLLWTSLSLFTGLWLVLSAAESRSQTAPLWHEGGTSDVDPELERLGRAFAGLSEKIQPAVVLVRVNLEPMSVPEGQGQRPRSKRGSGFIISSEGYILTANHVVEGAGEIEVQLADRRIFRAQVIGADRNVDVAVIKVEGAKDFRVIPLGNSDRIQVGELVMAAGHPNTSGPESVVTLGIISWRGRSQSVSLGFDLIQSDAGAIPGDSGGVMVNMKGQVVGMITRAAQGGKIGFAVPINVIKNIVPRLIEGEKIVWGWLGVRVSEVTSAMAETIGLSPVRGVVISSVLPDQPAEKMGVRAQDVVLFVNGSDVSSPREFSRIIGGTEAGREIKLTIFRQGETLNIPVLLGTRPQTSERRER